MIGSQMNRRDFMRAGVSAGVSGTMGGLNFPGSGPYLGQSNHALNHNLLDVTELREDYQVIQRDSDDAGACFIRIEDKMASSKAFQIKISDDAGRIWMEREIVLQELKTGQKAVIVKNIPVGGPYVIEILPAGKASRSNERIVFRNILVGDLWILGGQSNMFGISLAEERLPALPYLNMLNNLMFDPNSHWCAGIPPIARVPKNLAPFDLKTQYPGITDARIEQELSVNVPVGGIGPSYFFAKSLYDEGSDVPIGVIPCALGAALAVWDPSKRHENRYGFMYQQVMRAGGRVKGMLWYQGEQDAIFGDEHETVTHPSLIYPLSTYASQFKKFVEAIKQDFHNPDFVVITAQICRHHQGKKERYPYWEEIRETQRLIPSQIPNVHVVPTVDLDVVDGLHLNYWSQKRQGRRMAYVAFPYVKKAVAPRSEIKLKSVAYGNTPKPTIVVEYDGVTGRLRASGRPTGFQLRNKATGENVDYVFRVDFDPEKPATALLRISAPEKRDLLLVYAAGAIPYVNIVDENDMAVPAFGPAEIAPQGTV